MLVDGQRAEWLPDGRAPQPVLECLARMLEGIEIMTAGTVSSLMRQTDGHIATWKDVAWDRAGALSGVIFVVLTFIGITIADPNSTDIDANPDQNSSVIANLFVENRADMELGARFQIASIAFLIWFIAYLYRRVRTKENERGWISAAILGGGMALATIMLLFAAFTLAISTIDDYGTDTAVARTLAALSWDMVGLMSAPLATFIGSIAVASLRYGALPRWVGYTGAPLALIMLAAPISTLGEVFWLGFVIFWPWLLAVSIYLVIRPQIPTLEPRLG